VVLWALAPAHLGGGVDPLAGDAGAPEAPFFHRWLRDMVYFWAGLRRRALRVSRRLTVWIIRRTGSSR
jgi:hypothetical protein